MNHYPLIKTAINLKIPLIISTGMANKKDLIELKIFLKKYRYKKIAILKCTSQYPANIKNLNLSSLKYLKKIFNCTVGYSDHTIGINASLAAAVLGACVIEKHFTLNKKFSGPDHLLSSDPKEFTQLVNNIRQIEKMKGSKNIKPSNAEIKIRKKFRRSIVANRIIKKGTKITAKMLSLKRPGAGLHPIYLNKIIGKIANKNFYENEKLKL